METKTEAPEKTEQLAGAGGAIAKVEGDREAALTLTRIVWSKEKIEVMKREICPAGITDDEFAIFLEKCRRSQMDPLLGEADCVPRKVKVGEDDWGKAKYATKHVFQVREQGMEARADRFADFEGIEGEAVFKKDVFRFNAAAATVTHEFDVTGERGPLLGAWARVRRRGRAPIVVWLTFEERAVYYSKSGGAKELAETWAKMGPTMIRKCARFDALKRAYPNTYGGLTIDAEYSPPTEVEVNPEAPGGSGSRSATDRLGDKLKKKAEVFPFFGKVGGVEYGGRPMVEVPDEVLTKSVEHYSGKIDKDPMSAEAPAMLKNVEICRAELKKRGKPVPPGPKSAPPDEPPSSSKKTEPEDAQLVEEPGAGG